MFGELLQALAQQGQLAPGMLAGQAGIQVGQAIAAAILGDDIGAPQTQIQIIQALGLLTQALARMTQAPAAGVQAQSLAGQALAHAQEQLAVQTV